MKKMLLESMEHLVGLMPEKDLVNLCFKEIDKACDETNNILKENGISVGRVEILILNDKEYKRPQ